jgi:uncharacterized protein YggE
MRMKSGRLLRLVLFGSALALPVLAQLDSNTITVTASRTTAPPPDQILFSVAVNSAVDATLDQIVGSLSGTGITSADLYSVRVSTTGPATQIIPLSASSPAILAWSFSTTVPLAKMQSTISHLNALASSIGRNQSGLTLSFSVQAAQASDQSLPCPAVALIADARAQAQRLVDGAQVSLGPIVEVADIGSGSFPPIAVVLFDAVPGPPPGAGGVFTGILPVISFVTEPIYSAACSIRVKFRIVGG